MFRYVLIGLALLISATWAVSDIGATESRVGAMGGIGFYTQDNSNVFYFPGMIGQYSKQLVSELRTKNNDQVYTIGLHLPMGEKAVMGLYVNRPLGYEIGLKNTQLDRTVDLFLGFKGMNNTTGMKLSIGFDKTSEETGTTDEKEFARYLSLASGFSNQQMDVAFMIELPGTSWELEKENRKWGGFGASAQVRYFHQVREDLKLVPLMTFYYQSTSSEYDSGITGENKDKVDYGALDLGFGLGFNYQFNEENLVVLAIEGFGISRRTANEKKGDESTQSLTTLPGLYLGVESQINKWLIGRLGAAQVFQSSRESYKPYQGQEASATSYHSQFKATFGIGIRAGKFLLDLSVNEGLLFDGPNVLSGSNEPLAKKLSITYSY